MLYPSGLRSPENITCPSLILIRAQTGPNPDGVQGLQNTSWAQMLGVQDLGFFCSSWLQKPTTETVTEPTTDSSVHQSTQWDVFTLTLLDTSRFGFQSLYTSGAQVSLHHSCDRERLCGRSLFCCTVPKKRVIFWCNDCVDAISHCITQLRTELSRRQRVSYSTCSPPRFPAAATPSAHTVLTFQSVIVKSSSAVALLQRSPSFVTISGCIHLLPCTLSLSTR